MANSAVVKNEAKSVNAGVVDVKAAATAVDIAAESFVPPPDAEMEELAKPENAKNKKRGRPTKESIRKKAVAKEAKDLQGSEGRTVKENGCRRYLVGRHHLSPPPRHVGCCKRKARHRIH